MWDTTNGKLGEAVGEAAGRGVAKRRRQRPFLFWPTFSRAHSPAAPDTPSSPLNRVRAIIPPREKDRDGSRDARDRPPDHRAVRDPFPPPHAGRGRRLRARDRGAPLTRPLPEDLSNPLRARQQ